MVSSERRRTTGLDGLRAVAAGAAPRPTGVLALAGPDSRPTRHGDESHASEPPSVGIPTLT